MKEKIKRLFASIAAILMAIGLIGANAVPVFAAGDGSITIRNTTKGATYNIFKVFDATYSGTGADINVSYTYNGSDETFKSALSGTGSPFNFNAETKTVSLKEGKQSSDIVTFLNSQKDHLGSAAATPITGTGTDITFSSLPYGYYYITTTTGTVVSIDTTRPTATVVDKNESLQGPDKKETTATTPAEADWVEDLTANIGDTVKYKVTGTFQRYQKTDAGPVRITQLTIVDTMAAGLTPNKDVVITVTDATKDESATDRVKTLTSGTNYTVNYNDTNRTTTIVFTTSTGTDENPNFTYNAGDTYTITYSAVLNENAQIKSDDNKNTAALFYNNNIKVNEDSTKVRTYEVGLFKHDNTNTALPGAQFKLYTVATDGEPLKFIKTSDGTSEDATKQYRVAKSGETGVETLDVGTNGKLTVSGLKNGTYYFEETKAPDGYNLLTERKSVTVYNNNASIDVENNKGSLLPSTGGIGTTIFYIAGGILIIGAAVLLIARRKRNA